MLSDRAVIPPWGVHNGSSGAPYEILIDRDGSTITLETPGKATGYPVYRNDIVIMRSSGGGGYGDPLEREAGQVQQDVAYGYVSLDRAASGYGVVLNDGKVDAPATERQRAILRQRRFHLTVAASGHTAENYTGAKGWHRLVYLHEEDAGRFGLHQDDLLELLGRNPAPLRAWVRFDRAVPGQVPLDEFALRVLGVRPGDLVQIRGLKTPKITKGLAAAR